MKIVADLKLNHLNSIVLIGSANEEFSGDYTHCSDGRLLLSMNAWEGFVKAENFVEGQVVMFIFHATFEERYFHRRVKITVDRI